MQWTQVSKRDIDQYGPLESTHLRINNIVSLTSPHYVAKSKSLVSAELLALRLLGRGGKNVFELRDVR